MLLQLFMTGNEICFLLRMLIIGSKILIFPVKDVWSMQTETIKDSAGSGRKERNDGS